MNASPDSASDGPLGPDDLRNLVGELRALARQLLHCESGLHSLTPTALAMTALLRAKRADVDWDQVTWANRRHFFAAIMQSMQHALVDHARRRRARGRDKVVYLPPGDDVLRDLPGKADERPDLFMRVEEALALLDRENPQAAELLRLHYLAGYTLEEIARFNSCDEKTVDRRLKQAKVLFEKAYKKCPPG